MITQIEKNILDVDKNNKYSLKTYYLLKTLAFLTANKNMHCLMQIKCSY